VVVVVVVVVVVGEYVSSQVYLFACDKDIGLLMTSLLDPRPPKIKIGMKVKKQTRGE